MKTRFVLITLAVVRKNDSIIIGKKVDKPHPWLNGKWHIPGGCVNIGESPEEAVKREMREELGIDIEVGEIIDVGILYSPDWKGKKMYSALIYYECFPLTDKIKPTDDLVDAKWVRGKEIGKYLKEAENVISEGTKKYLDKLGWK